MKKLHSVIFMAFASFLGTSAHAEGVLGMESVPNEFGYNFFEFNYIAIDGMGIGPRPTDNSDMDGLRVKASHDIDPNLSLIGSISYADDRDADYSAFAFGAAYHQKLLQTQLQHSDFVFYAEVERMDLDVDTHAGDKGDDDIGLHAGASLRVRVVEKLEIFGDLSLRTTLDNDIAAEVGGRYTFTPRLHGVASVEISEADTFFAGVRYYYD